MFRFLGGIEKKIEPALRRLSSKSLLAAGIGFVVLVGLVLFYGVLSPLHHHIENGLRLKAAFQQELDDAQAKRSDNKMRALSTSRLPEAIGFLEQLFTARALQVNEIMIIRQGQFSAEAGENKQFMLMGLKVAVSGDQKKILQTLIDIGKNSVYPVAVQEVTMEGDKADIGLQIPVSNQ